MERSLLVRSLVLLLTGTTRVFAAEYSEEIFGFSSYDGIEVGCVLSLPDSGAGPFPGMLLIPGSGLHDADVTLYEPALEITTGEQALFRPLARHFARNGWAVARCNKRGASFRHQNDRPRVLEDSTLEDLVQDAREALATLRRHPRVAARPLVVLGHSEGALIASRLAQNRSDIDLLVLLGSVARDFGALIEYQLVDRNLAFLRQAADRDDDGQLTLDELDRLDGNLGLESVFVRNSADVLFGTITGDAEALAASEINPRTDRNGDGRLDIDTEIAVALRAQARRLVDLAAAGALGSYWQSLVEAPAPISEIHLVTAPILFVHGALDVQSPLEEALALMARLEKANRIDYDLLILPDLGHSLSPPNDTFPGDGGLSTLDNLTLNAPRPKIRRLLLERIEAALSRAWLPASDRP